MNQIKVVQGYQPFKRWELTTKGFNEITGNPCQDFRKNLHTDQTPDVRNERR